MGTIVSSSQELNATLFCRLLWKCIRFPFSMFAPQGTLCLVSAAGSTAWLMSAHDCLCCAGASACRCSMGAVTVPSPDKVSTNAVRPKPRHKLRCWHSFYWRAAFQLRRWLWWVRPARVGCIVAACAPGISSPGWNFSNKS